MNKQWEVWTKMEGGRAKRHYNGKSEASARQIFVAWKQDMQQAKTVMLLEDGDRVEEYSAPPKPEPIHSPEIVAVLARQSELFGVDASTYIVYGSPMRPMSTIWFRVSDAMCIPSDRQSTGYHTYVAVPQVLDKEVIEKYELVFVSRPATDK